MFYGYGFVCKRCCPAKRESPVDEPKQPSSSANAERCERSVADAQVVTPADVPSTPNPPPPNPPPSSPVIEPLETPTYPDLPFINPSLVFKDSDSEDDIYST